MIRDFYTVSRTLYHVTTIGFFGFGMETAMNGPVYAVLPARGVLAVTGADAVSFLQGLVSNDATQAAPGRAVFAALLTPQGKYLHDFFIVAGDAGLLLDCERPRIDNLAQRLKMFKLRSKVALDDISESFAVAALFGAAGAGYPDSGGRQFPDPRLAALGARVIMPRDGLDDALRAAGYAPADADAYDAHRLALGVPDGSRDIGIDKSVLLECGFDGLNGISWDKGCYMGQEVTARTKHRGLVKRGLIPVTFDGPPPPPGTPIMQAGREVGEMRSARGGRGLASLRLEALQAAAPLMGGETPLFPANPGP